jgi:hypothetical protein
MLQINLHIETAQRFSPKGMDRGCGACLSDE